MSRPCGLVVVDGLWIQTYSGFDLSAAETKSHCYAHHGYGYVPGEGLSWIVPPTRKLGLRL